MSLVHGNERPEKLCDSDAESEFNAKNVFNILRNFASS